MKTFLLAIIFICASGFSGCGAMEPKTVAEAQRAVIQAKIGYATAQKAALAYKRQPSCDTEGVIKPFCAKPEVVAQIQRADALAYAALNAAEAAVRAPEFGESQISAVIVSARAALKLFRDVTDNLPVKPDAKAAPAGPTKLGSIPLPAIA